MLSDKNCKGANEQIYLCHLKLGTMGSPFTASEFSIAGELEVLLLEIELVEVSVVRCWRREVVTRYLTRLLIIIGRAGFLILKRSSNPKRIHGGKRKWKTKNFI